MIEEAYKVFNLLRGCVCTYKPAGASCEYVALKIKTNICEGLNKLESTTPTAFLDSNTYTAKLLAKYESKQLTSYSNNVLCRGPTYQKHNFALSCPSLLGQRASGLFVVCINDNHIVKNMLYTLRFSKCFHIKGLLGRATRNFHIDEKVVAKAKYIGVNEIKFEKILASYQSATQRKLFEEYGLPLDSQEAYDFAVEGLYRPRIKGPPIIYSLKLVEFEPPYFTLEVQCINETEGFLMHLIHNLGINLKCFATCVSIRCIRYGCFHAEHSLVKEQWTLPEILNNVRLCWDILEETYPDKLKFSNTVNTLETPKEGKGYT